MKGGFMLTPANTTSFSAASPPLTGGRNLNTHWESQLSSRNNSDNMCDCVFGSVPSRAEVEKAILDLIRFMRGLPSTSERGELHELIHHHNNESTKLLQSPGFLKFFEAFSMMQEEPAIRNIVASLSCDEALWRAILNNKLVRDLQASVSTALVHENKEEKKLLMSHNEEPDITYLILRWIMDFAKSKISELVERFRLLVNEVLRHNDDPKDKPTSEVADFLEEKVKSSVLLAVIIIIIVVITRNQG